MNEYLYFSLKEFEDTYKVKIKDKLVDLQNFYNIINDNNVDLFIAGSYSRYIINSAFITTKANFSDIDIYFSDTNNSSRVISYMISKKNYIVCNTENAFMCLSCGFLYNKLHFIKNHCGTPNQVLDNFDFTIIKCGFYIEKNNNITIIIHKDYFKDNLKNNLIIKTENITLETFLRIIKYIKKGCYISKDEIEKLLITLSSKYNYFDLIDVCATIINDKSIHLMYKKYYGLATKYKTNIGI